MTPYRESLRQIHQVRPARGSYVTENQHQSESPAWKRSCVSNVIMVTKQIKKILFPVDFSENCSGAARYVELFAGQFEAEIMLLHVVGMGEHALAEDLLAGRTVQLDSFLAGELKYFATRRVCKIGDAATVIAEEARTWRPDLVMMPTHGLGVFRRRLLGSVTSKALHDLDCPVWTSVHSSAAPRLEDLHCHKILCAVDFGERSREILAWSAWLACEFQAELAIAHAAAPIQSAETDWYMGEEFARKAVEQGRSRMEKLIAESGTATPHVFIQPGTPAKVVAAAAAEYRADLVVIGRHGDDGILGDLFQNAWSIIGGSPCPVISI